MILKSAMSNKIRPTYRYRLTNSLGVALILLSAAANAQLPERIGKGLAKAGIKTDAVSIMVRTVDGETLVEHNADKAMRSASVMKLLTTYAALEILGPAWTWPTDIYALGEIRNGVLDGALVIKGYGDPSLSLERFWLLTQQLRQRGLREIKGGLYIDISHFTPGPAETANKLDDPWEIVPAPLMISLQAERLFFEPVNGTVKMRTEPNLDWNIQLDMPIVDGPCYTDVEDSWKPRMDWNTSPPTAYIKGQFPSGCQTRALNIGVTDPLYYASTVFRLLWEQQGGRLEGESRYGVAPPGLVPLARIESAPLSRAIMDMNKYSSNPMARQIYLSIGQAKKQPGKTTSESADSAIRSWLTDKQLHFPELVQDTGSGLSRSEQLSSRHWTDLLLNARQSRYAAELVASLPIVGIDGTMSKRLKGEAGAGWGHFKTGTLKDTKALAGYLTTARGRQLVLAVQINTPALERRADAVLEDIIRMLFEDEVVAPLITP